MKLKTILGERVVVLPQKEQERTTPSGIIIPKTAKDANDNIRTGVVVRKGTGAPYNKMDEIRVHDVVYYRKGAGKPHVEIADDGREIEYLILNFTDILLA